MPGTNSHIKALLFTSVAAVAAITLIGCCCGGGNASDWSDLESALEEAAATTTTETASAGSGELKQCKAIDSLSSCSEHTSKAFEFLGEDFYKSICELTDGTWTTGSCPTENALGRCDDQIGSVTLYYSTGSLSYDAATAEKGCTDILGKWSAL